MAMLPVMAIGADRGDYADDGDDDSDDDDAGDATDGNDDVSNSDAGGEDDNGAAGDNGGLLAIRQPTYRSDRRLPWQRGGHMLGKYPLGAYYDHPILCNIAVVSAYRNFSLTVLERALASNCVGCTRT